MMETPNDIAPYGDIILWEKPVQFAASLFIRNGSTVFDIGANTGGVAIALRRLAGQKGRLTAFECHPKMIIWCRENFRVNDARDIRLVEKACWNQAGANLRMASDEGFYSPSSSLVRAIKTDRHFEVATTTVDAVAASEGQWPDFIKIDVEGAEYEVLQGAEAVLNREPVIVLERMPPHQMPGREDRDPVPFLIEQGYRCFDVNSLEPLDPDEAFVLPTNILAIPPRLTGFAPRFTDAARLKSADGALTFPLDPGAYRISLDIAVQGEGTGAFRLHDSAGRLVLMAADRSERLAAPLCAVFPMRVDAPDTYSLTLEGETVSLGGLTVERIDGLQADAG